MKIITVEREGLVTEFSHWGVTYEYVYFFLSKCAVVDGAVSLRPFAFNDTVALDNPSKWLTANAAFWCRVYREVQTGIEQVEALSAIRGIYYAAELMGQGDVTARILAWWSASHELHQLPGLNCSQGGPSVQFLSSTLNNSQFKH